MNEKEQWIVDYIQNESTFKYVDIMDEDFVGSFIETFDDTDSEFLGLGAPKCKQLSKLLSSMYKNGVLDRWAHGIRSGYNQDYRNYNAPKWVYSYKIKGE